MKSLKLLYDAMFRYGGPWWKVHVFNAVGSLIFLVLAVLFLPSVAVALFGMFAGACWLNGAGVVMLRMDIIREQNWELLEYINTTSSEFRIWK